jgi:hypothetical protein
VLSSRLVTGEERLAALLDRGLALDRRAGEVQRDRKARASSGEIEQLIAAYQDWYAESLSKGRRRDPGPHGRAPLDETARARLAQWSEHSALERSLCKRAAEIRRGALPFTLEVRKGKAPVVDTRTASGTGKPVAC